ncbi:MAG: hypothetical protein C3F11_00265 [Methylocystaceae bacterium]|nr:MAG: hypothetical protein C3F11_00265 [Methylocystaceae bacterium]
MTLLRIGLESEWSKIGEFLRRNRVRLFASAMLALTAIVFEANGRAPGSVNLLPREFSGAARSNGAGSASRLT